MATDDKRRQMGIQPETAALLDSLWIRLVNITGTGMHRTEALRLGLKFLDEHVSEDELRAGVPW